MRHNFQLMARLGHHLEMTKVIANYVECTSAPQLLMDKTITTNKKCQLKIDINVEWLLFFFFFFFLISS